MLYLHCLFILFSTFLVFLFYGATGFGLTKNQRPIYIYHPQGTASSHNISLPWVHELTQTSLDLVEASLGQLALNGSSGGSSESMNSEGGGTALWEGEPTTTLRKGEPGAIWRKEAPSIEASGRPHSSKALLHKDHSSYIHSRFHVGMENYTNLSKDFLRSKGVSSEFVKMGLELDSFKERGDYSYKLHFNAFHSFQEHKAYINLLEAYAKIKLLDDGWSLTFGRKKHPWSWGDQLLGRGLWEPRFYWSRSEPESQGLMGLFLKSPQNKGGFRWVAAVTPFFMPDTLPYIQEENGVFRSANPWFLSSLESTSINGKSVDIRSRLVVASTKDILLKSPGAATKLEWEGEDLRWGFSLAYKPMNQFHLYAPVSLNIGAIDRGESHIELAMHLSVEYHRLWTHELTWKRGLWKFQLDVTHDQPLVSRDKYEGDNYLIQNMTDAYVYTMGLSKGWSESTKAPEFFMGHSYVNGGLAKDIGDFSGEKSYFGSRYELTHTTFLGMNRFLEPFLGSKFSSRFSAFYDWKQNGLFMKSFLGLHWTPQLVTYLKWHIFEVFGDIKPKFETGLTRRYRYHDVVSLGVRYDF